MSVLCEVVVKQLIPAVRIRAAKQLYNKHNFNQKEIASKLGITQAAVSKYLSGNYTEEIKKLEKDEIVDKISNEIVKAIIKKTFDKSSFEKITCKHCNKMLRRCHGL
jgi:predicted transcriptional regulator